MESNIITNICFDINSMEKFVLEESNIKNYNDVYIHFDVDFVLNCEGKTLSRYQMVTENLNSLEESGIYLSNESEIKCIIGNKSPFDLVLLNQLGLKYQLNINVSGYEYSDVPF